VRLIRDPTRPTPKVLRLCLTGEALWEAVNGSHSFWPSYPSGLTRDQGDAIAALLDELRGWMDIASELSYTEGRQAIDALTVYTKRLGELGLFIGTRVRHMLLTGGVSSGETAWRGFDIQFCPAHPLSTS
jgi:hypothetical protein